MDIKQIYPLDAKTFARYGRYVNLLEGEKVDCGSITLHLSKQAFTEFPLRAGITGVKGGDFTTKYMERHFLGEEVLVCGQDEMILTVAASSPEGVPLAKDIQCFFMRLGDAVVLNKGVWHDANHGVEKDTEYYFFGRDTKGMDEKLCRREVEWLEVSPNPVDIKLR